jgi:hypothetical protein
MHRRNFLKTAAAGAALAATGPYLRGADKAGNKTALVGTGEHRYECVHNWGELPADFQWQTTHGVCVDAAGLVYITHQGHNGKAALDIVLVFDPRASSSAPLARISSPAATASTCARRDPRSSFTSPTSPRCGPW